MAMPAAAHRWTIEERDAMPEDRLRRELLDGALLVSPVFAMHERRLHGDPARIQSACRHDARLQSTYQIEQPFGFPRAVST